MPGVLLCLGLFAQAVAAQAPASPGYVPQRVYDTARRAFSDFETMVAELARADVVLVGEHHADPNTHRLEMAILEGLRRRGAAVTVSLEMFERDVQGALNEYLASGSTEADFLKGSRPWPRYTTDYRALVEFAKANGWPVIAANVPRRFASEVAKAGLGAIETLSSADRLHAARDFHCPRDGYFDRFAAGMGEHPAPDVETVSPAGQRARTERYYESQCVKDETMAESIAAALQRRSAPVVHFNGAFHSDFRLGAAERTRRRLPDRRIVVVSILPVNDLDTLTPGGDDLNRADYLIFTIH